MTIILEKEAIMLYNIAACRCDGIGRRDGLKIRWWQHRVGSSPTTGTRNDKPPATGTKNPECVSIRDFY